MMMYFRILLISLMTLHAFVIHAAENGPTSLTGRRRLGSRKTSILIMWADDLGEGDVSFLSKSSIPYRKTPNIDALARSPNAIQMNHFHSPSVTCSPSRISILTGRSPVRDCVWGANSLMDKPFSSFNPEFPFEGRRDLTTASYARDLGYRTLFLGKWHLSSPQFSLRDYGWQEWMASGGNVPTYDMSCFCNNPRTWSTVCDGGHYVQKSNARLTQSYDCRIFASPQGTSVQIVKNSTSDVFVDRFTTFLGSLKPQEAFYTLISFPEPHAPFIAPPQIRNWILNYIQSYGSRTMKKLSYVRQVEAADFYGSIMVLDRAVGRVREALKRSGREEDTVVIFSSDNGPARSMGFGSTNGLRGWKQSLFEGGHRVPGILHWPSVIRAHVETNAVISMLDVTATVFDLLAMENNDDNDGRKQTMDGRSFLPALLRNPQLMQSWSRNASLFICAQTASGSRRACPSLAVMDDEYKLIVSLDDQGRGTVLEHTAQMYSFRRSEQASMFIPSPQVQVGGEPPSSEPPLYPVVWLRFNRLLQEAERFGRDVVADAQRRCRGPA